MQLNYLFFPSQFMGPKPQWEISFFQFDNQSSRDENRINIFAAAKDE